jgi:hypothetical protein
MKTVFSLLLLASACFAAQVAQAQATFDVRNKDSTHGINAPILDWNGVLLWGDQWKVELYGGPTVDSLTPVTASQNPARRYITSLKIPGYFSAHLEEGDATVRSVPSGATAWLQVKVWDADLGLSYEEAAAKDRGGYGQSITFQAMGGSLEALQVPGPLLGLQSFSVLQPIPEPSTYALMAMGLAWLVYGIRSSRSGV